MPKCTTDISWFMRGIAEGESFINRNMFIEMSHQLGYPLSDRSFFCATVRPKSPSAVIRNITLPLELLDHCKKLKKKISNDVFCYMNIKYNVVLIISGNNSERQHVIAQLSECLSTCSEPVEIGVGLAYTDFEKLVYSRVESQEALHCDNQYELIYYIDDIYARHDITLRKMDGEKHQIVEMFRSGQLEKMKEKIEILAENVRSESLIREHRPYPTSIRRTIMELLVEIIHVSADMGVDVEQATGYQQIYAQILETNDTPQIIQILCGISQKLYAQIEEIRSNAESSMLLHAKKCIDEHLCDPTLCLSTVSDQLGITSAYFSAIFNEETGSGFNEYIRLRRVEMAKSLLKTTDKKIKDIGLLCGFQSANYFTVVFRKTTGYTPGEFRKQNLII